jgi:hypothetical protein
LPYAEALVSEGQGPDLRGERSPDGVLGEDRVLKEITQGNHDKPSGRPPRVGEGDGRAVPSSPFIEEQVDVQGPGAVAVGGPFSAELSLDFEGSDQQLVRIKFTTN